MYWTIAEVEFELFISYILNLYDEMSISISLMIHLIPNYDLSKGVTHSLTFRHLDY